MTRRFMRWLGSPVRAPVEMALAFGAGWALGRYPHTWLYPAVILFIAMGGLDLAVWLTRKAD